jgi:hypothetical protein
MTAKVLVIVKDGQIVVRHTTGVETAVIVDGENVNLPDDWQKLPWKALHTVPVRLEHPQESTPSGQIFENQAQKRPPECPETQLAGPKTQVHHQDGPSGDDDMLKTHVYCGQCASHHLPGHCPADADTDVFEDLGRS